MPVITALEVHQRDKERVKLILDDEIALVLPLLEAAKLQRGQCLTDADVRALSEAGIIQNAFDRAVRYLSYRPRSVEEVRRYLVEKDVPEALVPIVIERLRERAYVDDRAFASFWLTNRERFKPLASRALRYELRQKGIADDIIEVTLADFDENDSAYRAAHARLRRYQGYTRQNFRQKLSALLRRRGFRFDTINDVAQRLQRELDETENDYFRDDDVDEFT